MRRRQEQLTEARRRLEEALESERSRVGGGSDAPVEAAAVRIRAELDCQRWRLHVNKLVDLFSLAWQEQQRTDALLKQCLPQLKDSFLLLSSYDQRPERRQKYRVSARVKGEREVLYTSLPHHNLAYFAGPGHSGAVSPGAV